MCVTDGKESKKRAELQTPIKWHHFTYSKWTDSIKKNFAIHVFDFDFG